MRLAYYLTKDTYSTLSSETFAGRIFRGLFSRNFSKYLIRESLFPQSFQNVISLFQNVFIDSRDVDGYFPSLTNSFECFISSKKRR